MNLSGRTRSWLTVALAMVVSSVAMPGASAHYIYEEHHTYETDEQCVANWSEVSHGNYDNGYAKGRAESRQDVPIWGINCAYERNRPAGWIADRWTYLYWTGSEWAACAWYDWTYNQSSGMDHVLTWHFRSPPCGDGYYSTNNWSAVYHNGAWRGHQRAIWSGYHYIN